MLHFGAWCSFSDVKCYFLCQTQFLELWSKSFSLVLSDTFAHMLLKGAAGVSNVLSRLFITFVETASFVNVTVEP